MADLAYAPVLPVNNGGARDSPRHTAMVRITHWMTTVSFLALVVSGVAILLAQPGLYWGETGIFGDPSLINLHLPQNEHHSGWGRSLHFLAAWVCVLTGVWYVLALPKSHGGVFGFMQPALKGDRLVPTKWAGIAYFVGTGFAVTIPIIWMVLASINHRTRDFNLNAQRQLQIRLRAERLRKPAEAEPAGEGAS